jgi:hypothetical protein
MLARKNKHNRSYDSLTRSQKFKISKRKSEKVVPTTNHVVPEIGDDGKPIEPSYTNRYQIAVSTNNNHLMLCAAAVLVHTGELEKSRAIIRQALMSGADRRTTACLLLGAAYTSLGRASTLVGRPERGVKQLTMALNLGLPGGSAMFIDLLMTDADRCSRLGDEREAIQRWQDIACLLGPKTPEYVYYRLAEAYEKNDRGFGGTFHENEVWGDCHKYDVLELIHKYLEPRFYLEIGVDEGASLSIARCQAIGVDPRPQLKLKEPLGENTSIITISSDGFFREHALNMLRPSPDMVFIDGMHLFEFALRDFMNIERYAAPETLVIIDDIYPCHPAQATRRRRTGSWTGDVWKLKRILQEYRPDLLLIALNASTTGLLLIAGLDRSSQILWDAYETIISRYVDDVEPPYDVLMRQGVFASDHPILESMLSLLKQARYEHWDITQVRYALREL